MSDNPVAVAPSGTPNAARKRKRPGNPTPIPKNAPIVVISSSEDDFEIIKPPPKRAVTARSAQQMPSSSQSQRSIAQTTPFQSPAARRTGDFQNASSSRNDVAGVSSSPTAPVIASGSTPDSRRSARKGALFLPSTKKALESMRTIQALRRIQLVSAGITNFRDGDAAPEEAGPSAENATTAAGVDTAWGGETSTAAAATAWGAEVTTEAATGGWGDATQPSENANTWGDATQPSGNVNTWGEAAAPSQDANGWGDAAAQPPQDANTWGDPSAGSAVNPNSQNAPPATNDGWGAPPATSQVTSGPSYQAGVDTSWDPPSEPNTNAEVASTAWGDSPPNPNASLNTAWGVPPSTSNNNAGPSYTAGGAWGEAPAPKLNANTGNTAWGEPPPTSNANSTTWGDAPSALTANAGQETQSFAAGVDTAWGGSPSDHTISNAGVDTSWGDVPASSNDNVNAGWGDAPGASAANTGWGAPAAPAASSSGGWHDSRAPPSNPRGEWNNTAARTSDTRYASAAPHNWGSSSRGGRADINSETRNSGTPPATARATDSWASSRASSSDRAWGASSKPPRAPANDGWGAAPDMSTDNRAIHDAGNARSSDTPARYQTAVSNRREIPGTSTVAQSNESVVETTQAAVDPNAWEPEPNTTVTATDWGDWDVPSSSSAPTGWGEPAQNRHSERSESSTARAPVAPQSGSADWGSAPSARPPSHQDNREARVPDAPKQDREPPSKPRRRVAEDFFLNSESPKPKVPEPIKTTAETGWGSWDPSGFAGTVIDDGWGNSLDLNSGNASSSRPSDRRESSARNESRHAPASISSRHGSESRRRSRDGGYSRSSRPTSRDRRDGGEHASRSRRASSREHTERESRHSTRGTDRRERHTSHPDERPSERRDSEREPRRRDHASTDRERHSERRESDRRDRHSEQRDGSDRHERRRDRHDDERRSERDPERRDRHRDRPDEERRESRHRRGSVGEDGERRSERRHSEREPEPRRADEDVPRRRRDSEGRDSRRASERDDRRESDRRESAVYKPAPKVHPDRLKAVRDPRDDFVEPGKQYLLDSVVHRLIPFHHPELPSFAAPVKSITSTNALPLGTRNRFGAAASKETPPSAAKEDPPVNTKPDPPIAAPKAAPAVTDDQGSVRRRPDSAQASKPALKVHPDRLNAVINPQEDFPEPGKPSSPLLLSINLITALDDRCSRCGGTCGDYHVD